MKSLLSTAVVLLATGAQAQMGGGFSGAGTGSQPGALVARVLVAPAGGFSAQGGGLGFQGGGGGLHGVTRPTFMGERNAVAAQFFNNAGVRLPVAAINPAGGTPGGTAVFAGGRVTTQPSNQIAAAATSTEPASSAAADQPAMPFAPPPIASQPAAAPIAAASTAVPSRPANARTVRR